MPVRSLARLAGFAFFLVACGPPPDPPPEFANTTLSGVVDGEEWTAQGGVAIDDDFTAGDNFLGNIFATEPSAEACAGSGEMPSVLVSLPIPGDQSCQGHDDCRFQPCVDGTCEGPPVYELTSRRPLTFFYDEGEQGGFPTTEISTNGAIRVDEVDLEGGVYRGALKARSDDDHEIDGTFEVSICE